MNDANKNTMRDSQGRYDSPEAMCVCGHPKTWHAAGRKGDCNGDCLAGTGADMPGDPSTAGLAIGAPHCDCAKFKKSRKK